VRVYKVKGFVRFQHRERIADVAPARTVRSAEAGLVDADLGGGLIKQRVARAGQGKSGGFRTVIAYRRGNRAIFLLGSPKTNGIMSATMSSTNSKSWGGASLDYPWIGLRHWRTGMN
jgi:hypothetical protein